MTRNRLYLLLALVMTGGYGWLIWSYYNTASDSHFTPCLFKNATGIACPSCGSTRSVLLFFQGSLKESLLLNPLGVIMGILLVILPMWLLYDLIFKRDTLYSGYRKFENTIRIPWVAIILIILILINWAWNIQKGL